MSPRSPVRFDRLAAGLALAAALAGAPARAAADAVGAYYERAVMSAANQRCGLFAPPLASALASAEAQARGAALRSGATAISLGQVEQRARAKADAVSCASPDVAKAADRVRGAFEGFARLQKMSFPGDTADWTANRATSRRAPVWKLSQPSRFAGGAAIFGLAGQDEAQMLAAAASFDDGADPYAARLVVRDAALAPQPFLNALQAAGRGPLPLARRTPPRTATRAILAEARGAAIPALLPAGAREGSLFRFPASAIAVLADLDPREAIAVEFLFSGPGGDQVRTAYVEVGDFAAGRAFLVSARR